VKKGTIRGCPGAGKTRYLMDLIGKAAAKYGIEQVGAVSYTKAAVTEMQERAGKHLGLSKTAARNIRTMHSHCWNLLGVRADMLADKYIADFNAKHPQFEISTKALSDGDIADPHFKRNDVMFAEIGVYRNTLLPLNLWNRDTRDMWVCWRDWMYENDLVDFTGMLEKTYQADLCPDIDVLFVDEAQDMSPLQYKLTELWAENTVSTIWVADPDQSIFRWAGACPETFMGIDAEWKQYLTHSYRMPKAVHKYVQSEILDHITDRESMDITCKDEEGKVLYCNYPDFMIPGSHMILVRCNYQVGGWIKHCIEQGALWHNPYKPDNLYWNPSKTKGFIAAKIHRRLQAGCSISMSDFNKMSQMTKATGNMKRGSKGQIKEMAEIGDHKKVDMNGCMEYGYLPEFLREDKPLQEKLTLTGKSGDMILSDENVLDREPMVTVGTVHSVKGGEADNVWVSNEIPWMIEKAVRRDEQTMNDELRVRYVAATRAISVLGVLV